MTSIGFNRPIIISPEKIIQSLKGISVFSGDGVFTRKCHSWFEERLNSHVLLTTSSTHALEMMAMLIDIRPGDEVIMPSFTFVSSANAFVLRGAKIVFVDIRPDTMNIDESLIEKAISKKTKAILVVHYAGVACEMKVIKAIADKYKLYLLEDAAPGMMGTYEGVPVGTLGDFGTYSFHETKNYHCGQGGLLIIKNKKFLKIAEMIKDNGTDRPSFLRGKVKKYSWKMLGSNFMLSEFNAAFLYAQLEQADHIALTRHQLWKDYHQGMKVLAQKGFIELPHIPEKCEHNAHTFYFKLKSSVERKKFVTFMSEHSVQVATHYVPLHSSLAGKKYGCFCGKDLFTTKESERLIRLPLYYNLSKQDVLKILELCFRFFLSQKIDKCK